MSIFGQLAACKVSDLLHGMTDLMCRAENLVCRKQIAGLLSEPWATTPHPRNRWVATSTSVSAGHCSMYLAGCHKFLQRFGRRMNWKFKDQISSEGVTGVTTLTRTTRVTRLTERQGLQDSELYSVLGRTWLAVLGCTWLY